MVAASVSAVLVRVGVIALILALLEWYVFQAVKVAFQRVSFRGWIFTGYWVIYLAFIALLTYGFLQPSLREGKGYGVVQVIMGFLVFWYVPKLLIVIFLLGEDVFRVTRGLAYRVANPEAVAQDGGSLISRSEFLSRFGILLAAIPMAAVGYGIVRGRYQFRIRRVPIFFPNLPASFDGFTVAQLSDIHIGSFSNPESVADGINLVNSLKPNVILFTGDLVNNRADELEPWIKTLQQLQAQDGKFSVLGNHDYGDYVNWPSIAAKQNNLNQLKQYQQTIGFQLLLNESVEITKDGEKIGIAGVENWGLPPFPQKGNLTKAMQGLEQVPFRILLSHDPTHFDQVVTKSAPAHQADLTLSGHTHGLQFGIEFGGMKWSPVEYKYPKWAGLYQVGKQYLYVNRGFGYIGFPGRVGILPEITQIILRRGLNPA